MRRQTPVTSLGLVLALGALAACQDLAERGDFDCFLLAGRYTLLEQAPLDSLLPLCAQRGIALLIGGAYNTGILATGAVEGAYFQYSPAPPEIMARVRRIEFEHLWFDSGYEPHPGEPGRERWLSYAANRTAHAWVMRQAGPERPWLVCIHGYVMGWPLLDLSLFPPEIFRDRLGLNMLLPTLPLHGRRSLGRVLYARRDGASWRLSMTRWWWGLARMG